MKNGFHGLRIFSIIVIAASLMLVPATFSSFADKPSNPGKPSFSASVEDLKAPKSVKLPDGRIAEKATFIFYKEGFGHKPGHDKGGGPPDKNGGKGGGEKCFAFLSKGAKWKSTENYIVNPTNADGLISTFVKSTLDQSVDSWDTEVSFNIFGTSTTNSSAIPITDSPDDDNIVALGAIVDSSGNLETNVIAVAVVWGIFGGPPQNRELVAWDVIFNDAAFKFGNAGDTSETELGDASMMDLENIGTHEIGHAAGMGHPDIGCTEETMHGSAAFGETKKRTLNSGDIAGINDLY